MGYFVFEHLEKNRAEFEGVTFSDFVSEYVVSEELAQEFIEYSQFNEAQIDITPYSASLKKALKANIAQQLFGPNAYEFILNAGSPMLEKVLELDARDSQ